MNPFRCITAPLTFVCLTLIVLFTFVGSAFCFIFSKNFRLITGNNLYTRNLKRFYYALDTIGLTDLSDEDLSEFLKVPDLKEKSFLRKLIKTLLL